jgi:hypothetical protein
MKYANEKETLWGVYLSEGESDGGPEVLYLSKLSKKDKMITILHELVHFLQDDSIKLRDPRDYDTLATYIKTLVSETCGYRK